MIIRMGKAHLGCPTVRSSKHATALRLLFVFSSLPGGREVACFGAPSESDEWMTRRALVAGPLVDGNGTCFIDVLDCTPEGRRRYLGAHGKPRAIYLSVFAPFTAPIIRCPAEGESAKDGAAPPEALVVYHGSDCELWKPDNAFKCYWNATVQSFQGPGCLRETQLDCACTHFTGARRSHAQPSARCQSQRVLVYAFCIFRAEYLLSVVVSAQISRAVSPRFASAPSPWTR